MKSTDKTGWSINIDTGGSFTTDCIGWDPQDRIQRCKVLSSDTHKGEIIRTVNKYSTLHAWTLYSGQPWLLKRIFFFDSYHENDFFKVLRNLTRKKWLTELL